MAKTLITDRKRVILLILIMAIVSISVTWAAIFILYESSIGQQRLRLSEIAQSQKFLLEAVARFDARNIEKESADRSFTLTLGQFREANNRFSGFGESGEFTLAKLEDEKIVFLQSRRHIFPDSLEAIPFLSEFAEPMRWNV